MLWFSLPPRLNVRLMAVICFISSLFRFFPYFRTLLTLSTRRSFNDCWKIDLFEFFYPFSSRKSTTLPRKSTIHLENHKLFSLLTKLSLFHKVFPLGSLFSPQNNKVSPKPHTFRANHRRKKSSTQANLFMNSTRHFPLATLFP